MTPYPKCSLITPTYNWPQALELLLLSIKNQTVLPNEVIIADDGSRHETTDLISKFQKDFPVPLIHIWHEDNGNQKPKIMNKAIAKAQYDYIIEIDGDIIMHKDFVKDHLKNAKEGQYLFGSRVNIKKQILDSIFTNKTIIFNLFSKGIKKRLRTLRIPFLMLFEKQHTQISKKLRGCNMSFWKKDFIQINGFNESLIGWGVDDSEMIQRLHNIGIVGKRLKHSGIVFHIYHPEQDKSHIAINDAMEDEVREKKIKFTEKGINQYLD
ncbi:MAG: glycosyl transferase [Flavobacterium sp.]|uniref:glycosyltransferase family 2 protein n=1 Tax=unclassified Flavobacterium TaxID=196869 RepID=UPI000C3B02AE|nr:MULTISPECIES: glycosyltransferase family 2 protein [unclassified Flavobacterium]MBF04313.1 glycosyl transferase [Flavobacterium sp.]MCO6163196.1 glycosyltransferase family 2 protein [Flavobacterium sp. NRK F7]|tara:strand:- start:235 stop:1035 length:801 start_codon:yes stop_codon:yes gene_type:complete